jgi:hypothetical protein
MRNINSDSNLKDAKLERALGSVFYAQDEIHKTCAICGKLQPDRYPAMSLPMDKSLSDMPGLYDGNIFICEDHVKDPAFTQFLISIFRLLKK